MRDHPTVPDYAFQLAFKVAHRLLRGFWLVRRPHTRGALVALWNGGDVLIVKNSYRRHYTLPGGYIRSDESPSEAGARELAEECGIYVQPELIREVYQRVHPFEFREDDVTIGEVEVPERPPIRIDHREVVDARFFSPEAAQKLPLVPHLAEYLAARAARATP
jgi:8-oxo-dGTP pyrophosphatase MutT (NUDIX family)